MAVNARITGKSGKDYFFQSYWLDDKVYPDDFGVHIFVNRIKDTRGYTDIKEWTIAPTINMHIGILNEQIIKTAEEERAKYFLYLPTATELANEIIEDLKEDNTYKIKIDDVNGMR